MKFLIVGLFSVTASVNAISTAQAQIKSKLNPTVATRLQPNELIRYYKIRPHDQVYDVPYQVLIIVTRDACTVKTNKWEHIEKLNAAQKDDLQVTLSYQEAKDFARPYVPPEEPIPPQFDLDFYLAFRKKGKTITWNSIRNGKPQLPSLFDFLEVCQYLARQEKEPDEDEKKK